MILFFVNSALRILILLIFASSVMSWFNPDPKNPLVRFVHAIVDPLLHPIRSILPGTMGMDFSPMVAMLVLWFLQSLLQRGFAPGVTP